MSLAEHERDDERGAVEEADVPDSLDVQPEDPDYAGRESPAPIDRD